MDNEVRKAMSLLKAGDIVHAPSGQLVEVVSIIPHEPIRGYYTAIAAPIAGGPFVTFWHLEDYMICLGQPPTAPDPVNHPAHYTAHPSGVECITITEHMNFNIGNAMKYLWRAGSKGEALEDLKKAAWYVNREIGRVGKAVGR